MREIRLGALRMIMPAFDAASRGDAHDHGHSQPSPCAITHLRRLVHQLVKCRIDEVGELDLDDGAEAVHRHPDGGADDASLGEWGIDDALAPEAFAEAFSDAEDAAEPADIFADEHDALKIGRAHV